MTDAVDTASKREVAFTRRTPSAIHFSPEFIASLAPLAIRKQAAEVLEEPTITGLLFGNVSGQLIVLRAFKPIGPEMVTEGGQPPGILPGSPLGKYVSTLKHEPNLQPADLVGSCTFETRPTRADEEMAFYNRHFRRASDVALRLRPAAQSAIVTDIFVRNAGGSISAAVSGTATLRILSEGPVDQLINLTPRAAIDESLYLKVYQLSEAEPVQSVWDPVRLKLHQRRVLLWATPAALAGIILGVGLGMRASLSSPPNSAASSLDRKAAAPAQKFSRGEIAPLSKTPAPVATPNLSRSSSVTSGALQQTPLAAQGPTGPPPKSLKPVLDSARAAVATPKSNKVPAPRVLAAGQVAPPKVSEGKSGLSPLQARAIPPEEIVPFPQLKLSPVSVTPTSQSNLPVQTQVTQSPSQGTRLPPALPPNKTSQTPLVIPAQPLRQVMPASLSPGMMLFKDSAVVINVTVDARGHVTAARPIPGTDKVGQSIVGLALTAAKQWQFRPATEDGQSVQSQYVITFRFHPNS